MSVLVCIFLAARVKSILTLIPVPSLSLMRLFFSSLFRLLARGERPTEYEDGFLLLAGLLACLLACVVRLDCR